MTKGYSSKRIILHAALLSTLLMILYARFVLAYYSKCFIIENAPDSLGLLFGYSEQEVFQFIKARSSVQLRCYLDFLYIWDSLFPIIYTLMYIVWIIYFFDRWQYLLIIPFTRMITDWIENWLEFTMISTYFESGLISEDLIAYGSVVTVIKWSLSVVIYTIILLGIINKLRVNLIKPKLL